WTHATDDELVLSGRNDPHGDIPGALSFEARVRVLTAGGTARGDGDAVAVEGATALTLLVAIATSYVTFEDLSGHPSATTTAQLAAAARRGYDEIASDTAREHQALFRRLDLDLGEEIGRASCREREEM